MTDHRRPPQICTLLASTCLIIVPFPTPVSCVCCRRPGRRCAAHFRTRVIRPAEPILHSKMAAERLVQVSIVTALTSTEVLSRAYKADVSLKLIYKDVAKHFDVRKDRISLVSESKKLDSMARKATLKSLLGKDIRVLTLQVVVAYEDSDSCPGLASSSSSDGGPPERVESSDDESSDDDSVLDLLGLRRNRIDKCNQMIDKCKQMSQQVCKLPTCEWCKGPAGKMCPRCRSSFYCSKECQKRHWKGEHRNHCGTRAELKINQSAHPAQVNALCELCNRAAPKMCSRCTTTYYCTRECQKRHWKLGHKNQCPKR